MTQISTKDWTEARRLVAEEPPMSAVRLLEQKVALQRTCPKCKAKRTKPCERLLGEVGGVLHPERIEAAYR